MNLSEKTKQQVQQLLQQRQKLMAIKLVYDEGGCDLQEAKEYVDNLEAAASRPPNKHDDPDSIILSYLAAGKKIEAVKYYKDISGQSLAESLSYVDALAKGIKAGAHTMSHNTQIDRIVREQQFSRRSGKPRTATLISIIIVLLIAALFVYAFFLH
ncbi:hypothetical protein [Chitinophaga solisilvae]|uniref:hypothetical protein n=1 Tax=Chitinophaga solisilvae TaxID=1233460 RepID=UPI00136EC3F2|nr:hypothetical protein [Chitinophaga solisilvae]